MRNRANGTRPEEGQAKSGRGSDQDDPDDHKGGDHGSGEDRPDGGGMAQIHEVTGDEPCLHCADEEQRGSGEVAFAEGETHQGEGKEQNPDDGVATVHSR